MAHTFSRSTQEAILVYTEFQDSQDYTESLLSKTKQNKQTKKKTKDLK